MHHSYSGLLPLSCKQVTGVRFFDDALLNHTLTTAQKMNYEI